MSEDNTSSRRQSLWELLRTLLVMLASAAHSGLAAAEAFDMPSRTDTARRARAAALWLFVSAAIFFLAASIVHVCGLHRLVGEVLGITGIALLFGCIYCGLRYPTLNRDDSCL